MRTHYEPDEQQEFEAGCALLTARLGAWAAERRLPCDTLMLHSLLEYRHLATADGRLGRWEPHHIEQALLRWLPQAVTELPGEEPADGPGTLRTLLTYLHETGLADPLGPRLEESLAAVDAAAGDYRSAMADRTRWGLAKFWATTAAESGVDLGDEAAMQGFVAKAQQGEVPYDAAALEVIMRRRMTGRALSTDARAVLQLPVVLPPDAELREQAERTPLLEQLRGLAAWAGREGRPVTATGRLRLADARTLVSELGTGDRVTSVRSSSDLPQLGLLVEWARKARLVRVAKGRLYAVAKASPVLADPMALWLRAFETLPELRGQLLGARSGWHVESMLFDTYHVVLPDVLNTLYSLPHPMPWPRLRDSVHLTYRQLLDPGSAPRSQRKMWLDDADGDLLRVLDVLEGLGVLERRQGMADPVFLETGPPDPDALTGDGAEESGPSPAVPDDMPDELAALLAQALGDGDGEDAGERHRALHEELASGPVELISLTPLGTRAVRDRLLAQGRHAPLVGELEQASPAGLLGTLAEGYDEDAATAELAGWLAARDDRGAAMEELVGAVRTAPFRSRSHAMLSVLLTRLPVPEGERLLRGLRDDAELAPAALSVLCDHEVLDVEDLNDQEDLLVMAEHLLQAVELSGGPDPQGGAAEALREQGPEMTQAVTAALASGHPDKAALEELRRLTA